MSRPHHPGLGLVLGTRDIETKVQPLPSWTYYPSEGAKRVSQTASEQGRECWSTTPQRQGTKGTERPGTRRKLSHDTLLPRTGPGSAVELCGAYVGDSPCSLSTNNGQRLPVLLRTEI